MMASGPACIAALGRVLQLCKTLAYPNIENDVRAPDLHPPPAVAITRGRSSKGPQLRRVRLRAAAHILILPLAGCFATVPEKVLVPTPVACVRPDQVPTRPPLVLDKEMPKADRGARVLALVNYQTLAEPYISRLEAIAQGCSRLPN